MRRFMFTSHRTDDRRLFPSDARPTLIWASLHIIFYIQFPSQFLSHTHASLTRKLLLLWEGNMSRRHDPL